MAQGIHKGTWWFVRGVTWMAFCFGLIGLIVRYGMLELKMANAPELASVWGMYLLGAAIGAFERVGRLVSSRTRLGSWSAAKK